MFKCKNGDQWLLPEIYYIPKLCNNLVSLGQLTETRHKIVMDDDLLKVFDKNAPRLIMKVKRTANRLYKVDLKPIVPVCLMASVCGGISHGCGMVDWAM